ncbi:hydroxyacylglutathione hydrolase [Pseudoxanthomonas sp. GM95]|uniref:hydroxyacylglutathione hydrolase n=1 Tax=Pseudoxanthomonas sp. GM95 TaxID=1881043 RepID=UPI0008C31C51|nr:hydroxyacylglutathione hydrolase [Pseudoxanthomonas sp. GM95]SEK73046.1 hydroxyacylglutathione hydrolase [Pseudoxanthomonas sp. GM95]
MPSLSALTAFDDNYIWVLTSDEGGAVIVDPGDAAPVLAAAQQGLKPAAVLLTHHHDDHIGGVAGLLEKWPDLPVIAADDERITTATHKVADGEVFEAAGMTFKAIFVPGHTRTHVAFHRQAPGGELFSGDTLFSLGCGRLFEGTPAQMLASLETLAALPDDTPICCGHEYTQSNAAFALAVEPGNAALQARAAEVRTLRAGGHSTLPVSLATERATNPFLRVDVPEVAQSVDTWLQATAADRIDTFAGLRRWKDGFRA